MKARYYTFTCTRGEGTSKAELLIGGLYRSARERDESLRLSRSRKRWERCRRKSERMDRLPDDFWTGK